MSPGDDRSIRGLEIEVEAELAVVQSSRADEPSGIPEAEWLFDPTDTVREEIGLRNLLGAVEVLESEPQPDPAIRRSPDIDDEGWPS